MEPNDQRSLAKREDRAVPAPTSVISYDELAFQQAILPVNRAEEWKDYERP